MQFSRRKFIQASVAFAGLNILPAHAWARSPNSKIGIAYIGLGGRGRAVMNGIASHKMTQTVALCDIDINNLQKGSELYPNAQTFNDYRKMLLQLGDKIDAVMIATPDHTHAPAAIMAMNLGKHVYCEKPHSHGIAEAYQMNALAKEKGLSTQMGIQLHSTTGYRTLTHYIQDGAIGRISKAYAWSHKNWGYDKALPTGPTRVPNHIDWDLWLGTAADRPYLKNMYHPANWRRMIDFGNGTLGDMGVHIFDPVISSLALNQPTKITTNCREPNGYSHPSSHIIEYEFDGSKYTDSKFSLTWFDGKFAPKTDTEIADLQMPDGRELPNQAIMFIGEKGQRILLPHASGPQFLPRSIQETLRRPKFSPISHYHEWVDASMGNGLNCKADFDYAQTLTSTVLLGVLGNRFPGQQLNWDADNMRFTNNEAANQLVTKAYRKQF
ncbi:Gfo/Idh/MocA family oxidoreductase [Coraliomargarita sp. W4R53]